jgi:hypothetical protein
MGDSKNGCDFYGTTTKYTGTAPSTCKTDNPTNPDLAVYNVYSVLFDIHFKSKNWP